MFWLHHQMLNPQSFLWFKLSNYKSCSCLYLFHVQPGHFWFRILLMYELMLWGLIGCMLPPSILLCHFYAYFTYSQGIFLFKIFPFSMWPHAFGACYHFLYFLFQEVPPDTKKGHIGAKISAWCLMIYLHLFIVRCHYQLL
jgi:hypothetical protein